MALKSAGKLGSPYEAHRKFAGSAPATCLAGAAANFAGANAVNPPVQTPTIFTTTHWSIVLAAGGSSSPRAREALERLCRAYWFPLYGYVRSKGFSPHDAEDLTQEFFTKFIASDALRTVSQERGRFRAFLLASLNHFLANEWDRLSAQKRGGQQIAFSFDA